jgi:hypothetical protein
MSAETRHPKPSSEVLEMLWGAEFAPQSKKDNMKLVSRQKNIYELPSTGKLSVRTLIIPFI